MTPEREFAFSFEINDLGGGRCRFRTCDPCRVNASDGQAWHRLTRESRANGGVGKPLSAEVLHRDLHQHVCVKRNYLAFSPCRHA
jgi:hypothetical protein